MFHRSLDPATGSSYRPSWVLPVLGLSVWLLLTGCTRGDGGAPTAANTSAQRLTEITVTATDLKLDPAAYTVPVNQPVRLTFVNKGLIEHDWAAVGLTSKDVRIERQSSNLSQRMATEVKDLAARNIPHPAAGPGQETVIRFTPTSAGTFDVICEVPGHKEAGMVAKMIVADLAGASASQGTVQRHPMGSASAPNELPAYASNASAAAVPVTAPRLAPAQIAAPVGVRPPQLVRAEVEAKEVTAYVDEGVATNFWTFGGTIPGPMLRARVGDTMELTFKNAAESRVTHSIDLHAVTGPGGGAAVTQVAPGEQSTFRFRALNPGVYVYHCATPPVAHHLAQGMYGLIVIEPPEGLPAVDREFYVMQGELYLAGDRGDKGERQYSMERMLDERPEYVLLNGAVGALTGERALQARVGETVRIFFGVGGPNVTSSFHVIGEIFDRVAPEGSSEYATNVQTTLVPAGGATMVEFKLDYPGDYVLVDHSLGRVGKGAAAILHVEGQVNSAIFEPLSPTQASSGSMSH